MFLNVTHVLFDMDGLLLDTECIYTKVTQKIVSRFGKNFDWSVKSNMIGRPAHESAQYLVETLVLPISAQDYLDERNSMLEQEFEHCQALPGAELLIRNLKKINIPIALATSSSDKLYRIKSAKHRQWFDLFDAVVTCDNRHVEKGKPNPDIFLHAMSLIDGTAENTLVFEDAPSGLAAAKAAGMPVVIVPDPNMDRKRFLQADLILNNLEEFDPFKMLGRV